MACSLLMFPTSASAADPHPHTIAGQEYAFGLYPESKTILPLERGPGGELMGPNGHMSAGGDDAKRMILSHDGLRLYVSHSAASGNGKVSILDPNSGQLIGAVTVGQAPYGLAESPDGSFLYVANTVSDSISVIDVESKTKRRDIAVANAPKNIAVHPASGRVYVTSEDGPGTLTEINVSNNDSKRTFPMAAGDCKVPAGLAVSPRVPHVYVLCRNGPGSTTGMFVTVNTDTERVDHFKGIVTSDSLLITKDGNFLYAADPFRNTDNNTGTKVEFFDVRGDTPVGGFSADPPDVGITKAKAIAVALSPDEQHLYSMNDDGTMAHYQLAKNADGFPVPVFDERVPALHGAVAADIAVGKIFGKLNITAETRFRTTGNVTDEVVQGDDLLIEIHVGWEPSNPVPSGKLTVTLDDTVVLGSSLDAKDHRIEVRPVNWTPGLHTIKVSYPPDPGDNSAYIGATGTASLLVHKELTIDTELPDVILGQPYGGADGFKLRASGGWVGYKWTVENLPAGLTFSEDEISGTVGPAAGATYPLPRDVTLKVSDTQNSTQHNDTKTMGVLIVKSLQSTSKNVIQLTNKAEAHVKLTASGGVSPYSWSLMTPGVLPDRLTMDSSGNITGATTEAREYGPVYVTVTDDTFPRQSDVVPLYFNVLKELSIATSNLPDGVVGDSSYVGTLEAAGGTGKFTWAIPDNDLPPGLRLDPATGKITGEPTKEDTYTFRVRATEADDNPNQEPPSIERPVTLKVNAAPAVTNEALPDAVMGKTYEGAQLTASGGTGSYTWSVPADSLPDGLELESSSGEITGTPTKVGTFSFTATVTDSATKLTGNKPLKITVAEAALAATTTKLADPDPVPAGEPVRLEAGVTETNSQVPVTDGTVTFQLTAAGQNTVTSPAIQVENGAASWSAAALASGDYTATAQYSGGGQHAPSSDDASVKVLQELLIEPQQLAPGLTGKPYSTDGISFQATGGSGPSYSFSGTGLPGELQVETSGTLTGSWTPEVKGAYPFTVTVTDEAGNQAKETFTITIAEQLTVTTTSVDAVAGESFSAPLEASGGTLPYTWTLATTSPPSPATAAEPSSWIELNDGILSGTPPADTEPGSYPVAVQLHDDSDPAQEATATLNVDVHEAGSVFVATNALPSGVVGTTYEQALQAEGGSGAYTWTVTEGLPKGLKLDSGGTLSGTPEEAGESFTFTVTATDTSTPKLSGSAGLELTVTDPPPKPIITTVSLPQATTGASYEQTLQAEGGTDPYAWSITEGQLPEGLELDPAAGVITGTPAAAGTTSFTVTATDANGQQDTQQYTVITSAADASPSPPSDPTTATPQVSQVPKGAPNTGAGGSSPALLLPPLLPSPMRRPHRVEHSRQ
ncbi:putative Ig domain-containing protein [Streptomyces sp. NPDC126514]|uniref:putative Ig domain-containing protein n=1 Tax=Streptomyces sp. NPDC126514 TaxID=3155210 RepID=UPI00331E6401